MQDAETATMITTSGFFTLNEKQAWEHAFALLGALAKDIYYTPGYYTAYEHNLNSRATCFIYREDTNVFLYPFLLSEVCKEFTASAETYYDIEGAYGYNGPLTNSGDKNFLQRANEEFVKKCAERNIIAEFTRFNPVIKNHELLAYMNVIHANDNIILDLSIQDLWMNAYEHSTRKNINKAERSGLTVKYVSGTSISKTEFDAFLEIYYNTMKRNNAREDYYFPEKYFKDLTHHCSASCHFFFTMNGEKPVSCELVLTGSQTGYSFLGGTLADYFSFRANDILKHHIILRLREMDIRYYCLGGGTSFGDGIFKYKKCFAKNGETPFYIGKKIHNETLYNAVVANWQRKFPEKAESYKQLLLKYKY